MERYEVTVAGRIDRRRATALACDEFRWLPDGRSLLVFTAPDQAALYGLIARLRDAGIALVALRPSVDWAGTTSSAGDARSRNGGE